jgi:hypothetical protein
MQETRGQNDAVGIFVKHAAIRVPQSHSGAAGNAAGQTSVCWISPRHVRRLLYRHRPFSGDTEDGGCTGRLCGPGQTASWDPIGGSGTDANLAWLTSGEYVMSLAAVQKYGTSFMHGINSMRQPPVEQAERPPTRIGQATDRSGDRGVLAARAARGRGKGGTQKQRLVLDRQDGAPLFQ